MSDLLDELDADLLEDKTQTEGYALNGKLLAQLWSYARVYPKDLLAIALFAILTATMEVSYPLLTKAIIDTVAENQDSAVLYQYALLLVLVTVVISISICGFIRIAGKLDCAISHDIRRDGFDRIQTLSFSYFNKKPVGWLMARMTADCDRLSSVLVWGFLDIAWGLTMILGVIIAMFWLNPLLACVVLIVMPLLAIVSAYFQRRLLVSARAATAINSRITATYNEAITGVVTSKMFGREQANQNEFKGLTQRMADAKVKNMTYASIYLPIVITLASLTIGLTLVTGGVKVLGGVITVGTLIAFMRFANIIFEPIEQISSRFAELQMAQASAERIFGLINEQPEIQDRENLSIDVADATPIEKIELHGVSFGYDNDQVILKDINLRAMQGQSIAIVGPTGGGKSTLVNVIARFFEPTVGTVTINDLDYREYPLHWLQSRLGVILQESHLFSGTLMENIRYGRLEATDDEVIAASRMAGAHDFIVQFKDGYQTEAGERGNRLSAGQKQLGSFARAIVSDPQILIMDEATSAIDTETEQQIQRGLVSLLQGRIAFIIAHRLSTIRQADLIIFIDSGAIIERGSHTELMQLGGRYCALYKLQQLQQSKHSIYEK